MHVSYILHLLSNIVTLASFLKHKKLFCSKRVHLACIYVNCWYILQLDEKKDIGYNIIEDAIKIPDTSLSDTSTFFGTITLKITDTTSEKMIKWLHTFYLCNWHFPGNILLNPFWIFKCLLSMLLIITSTCYSLL